ncbi:MAG TPA: hypothetical protein VKT30_15870, partial [Caulobacteraceae bacterium]|nr:hypothetical protein [Caulobacteraceae bacterium]
RRGRGRFRLAGRPRAKAERRALRVVGHGIARPWRISLAQMLSRNRAKSRRGGQAPAAAMHGLAAPLQA